MCCCFIMLRTAIKNGAVIMVLYSGMALYILMIFDGLADDGGQLDYIDVLC